jgi:hypothetical protein
MATASAGQGGLASRIREVELAGQNRPRRTRLLHTSTVIGVLLLAAFGILVGACSEGKNAAPTATPEWFADFPGPWQGPQGMYIAPEVNNLKMDPSGHFADDVLIVNFRDDLPKERIAEILAENDLSAGWIMWNKYSGSFLVAVDPDQTDTILAKLNSAEYQAEIDYAENNSVQ